MDGSKQTRLFADSPWFVPHNLAHKEEEEKEKKFFPKMNKRENFSQIFRYK
jgi:hypothetical protein